ASPTSIPRSAPSPAPMRAPFPLPLPRRLPISAPEAAPVAAPTIVPVDRGPLAHPAHRATSAPTPVARAPFTNASPESYYIRTSRTDLQGDFEGHVPDRAHRGGSSSAPWPPPHPSL